MGFIALALVTFAPLAQAALPTPAEFATSMTSSTGDAADYSVAGIFTGGGLKFMIWATVIGGLIGLVFWGLSKIFFRKKI